MQSIILLAFEILLLAAAFSLVWWGVSRMALPEPVRTILLVASGLVALLLVWYFVSAGAPLRLTR